MLESILSPQQYIHQCGVYDLIGSSKPMTINVNIVGHKKNPKQQKHTYKEYKIEKNTWRLEGNLIGYGVQWEQKDEGE